LAADRLHARRHRAPPRRPDLDHAPLAGGRRASATALGLRPPAQP
jgi:hypothetical protein